MVSTFAFEFATLLPESAINSKNFKELVQYIEMQDFHTVFSHTHKDNNVILRAGKRHAGLFEITELFTVLHLFAAQRKQDLVVIGKIDGEKYQHRIFGTLSIQKLRSWSETLNQHLTENAA